MNKRGSFNRIEVTLIAIGVLIVGATAGAIGGFRVARQIAGAMLAVGGTDGSERAALEEKYGEATNTRGVEEWILKDFFGNRRDGIFVDVGANHHQTYSNTYYLEKELGWSGVAIEPQTEFAEGYRQYRPRTAFVPLFVSDVSDQTATLYVGDQSLVASGSREFTETFSGAVAGRPVRTTTLDDVLDRLGIRRIDFLSMDIELAEPAALAGFSIRRFMPALVAVEAHPPIRQQLLDYFAQHDYTVIGKYWRADSENFWFAPMGAVRDSPSHD
jgi:FkbM family methyltransferase